MFIGQRSPEPRQARWLRAQEEGSHEAWRLRTAPSGRLPKSPDWIRLNSAPAIDPRIRARKPRPMARSHPPDAKGDRRTKKPASLSVSDVLRRGARAPIGVISVPGCAGGAIRASRSSNSRRRSRWASPPRRWPASRLPIWCWNPRPGLACWRSSPNSPGHGFHTRDPR